MTPRRVRAYMSVFVVLGAGVGANVLFLQPNGGRPWQPPEDRLAARSQVATDKTIGTVAVPQKARPTGGPVREATATTIRAVQRELKIAGYYRGPEDGMANLSTHAAIMAYESATGLELTGIPTDALLKGLILGAGGAAGVATSPKKVVEGTPAEQITRLLQQLLKTRGYKIGAIDGRLDEDTKRAILEFEAEQGMTPSGRISAPLLARLQRAVTPARVVAGR